MTTSTEVKSNLEVRSIGNMLALVAADEIEAGQVIFKLEGDIIDKPTRTSLQIGKNKHIEDKRIAFTNHSCNPSTFIYEDALISRRKIHKGEEITIDYNLTEDVVTHPFICNCCGRTITGKKSTFYRDMMVWFYLHFLANAANKAGLSSRSGRARKE